jgi:hypothetical protein
MKFKRRTYSSREVDNMTAAERNSYNVSPSAAELEKEQKRSLPKKQTTCRQCGTASWAKRGERCVKCGKTK